MQILSALLFGSFAWHECRRGGLCNENEIDCFKRRAVEAAAFFRFARHGNKKALTYRKISDLLNLAWIEKG